MSRHLYLPIVLVFVGDAHFGQRCSDTSSPCSINFSLLESFRISLFIGVLIFLKRYFAIALGYSGNWSFVWMPFSLSGNALNGTRRWKPLDPENLIPTLWTPCFSSSSIRSLAAILP